MFFFLKSWWSTFIQWVILINSMFQSLLLAAVAVAKLLSMATKIASFIVPAWQGKLHALPRALGLNCNPLLLPCTWHILGAKMDAKKHVTEPPAECNSWTCMLEYWSQPDDVMNAWTRDGESDLMAGFTHTLSWAIAVSLQGEVHQALLKAPLLTTEWNGKKSTTEFSHARRQHHHRVSISPQTRR